MTWKSNRQDYGRVTILFHWISAILIISMLPMGFAMQNIDSVATQMLVYQMHAAIGILVLLLTIARLIWIWIDGLPEQPPGFSKLHAFGFYANHILLFIIILSLSASGIAILETSELGDILFGSSSVAIPTDLTQLPPSKAHSIWVWLFITLFIIHVVGTLWHQFTKSDVMARMGWRGWKTKQSPK